MKLKGVLVFLLFEALFCVAYADVGLNARLQGHYDYSSLSALRAKAQNTGFSGMISPSLRVRITPAFSLDVGPFFMISRERTLTIVSASTNIQNLHVSPYGGGGELGVSLHRLSMFGGYGLYYGSARKVEDGTGRDYSLRSASGYHIGAGFRLFHWSRVALYMTALYREINYDEIELKGSDDSFLLAIQGGDWKQRFGTVGVGLDVTLF